jgi:hypothetical protein
MSYKPQYLIPTFFEIPFSKKFAKKRNTHGHVDFRDQFLLYFASKLAAVALSSYVIIY